MAFEFQRNENNVPPLTLENKVFQAMGAVSACWDNLEGAGCFESTRAKDICDKLIEEITVSVTADEIDERSSDAVELLNDLIAAGAPIKILDYDANDNDITPTS